MRVRKPARGQAGRIARARNRLWVASLIAALLAAAVLAAATMLAAAPAHAQDLPDLATPKVLRVCADPSDMPLSNRKGEGFENRIAAILADELKIPLRTYWLEQGPGFVRNTLDGGLCDLIIGYATGTELVLHTNPYYRSLYVLLSRHGELSGMTGLGDPRLKTRRIGLVAGGPVGDHLAEHGLVEHTQPYSPYMLGRAQGTPAAAMVADLVAGRIDVAVLWGPEAGWLARQSGAALDMVPLLHEGDRPPLSFRISLAVRPSEQAWKRLLNTILARRRAEILAVLHDYAVPLLDEEDRLIEPGEGSAKP